jgi:acetyltransferase AlgX (SGNH hydrolase-like protein)
MAIFEGDQGWLFLTDGNNDTLAYSTGQRTVDDSVVRGWHRLLELREAWLARRGIAFYTFIAPNKEVVYADRLPEAVPPISDDRPLRQIERRLAASSTARLEHPLDALIDARSSRETYPSHDTHWNGWGAFVFYREAMKVIAKDFPDVRVLDESEVRFEEPMATGDLGVKLDPPIKTPTVWARLLAPRAAVTFDNEVANNGRLTRTAWTTGDAGLKALIFHDSFHTWTKPMFAESFPTTVSAHNYRLDFDLVEQEQPDLVLVEITERFMVRVPNDADGMTTAQLQLAKASGQLDPRDAVPYR